jgi:hypothetical protein
MWLAWPSNNSRTVPLLDHLFWLKCVYDSRQLVVFSSQFKCVLFDVEDDSLHDDEYSLSMGQGQAGDITILRNNSMNAASQVSTLSPPPPPPPTLPRQVHSLLASLGHLLFSLICGLV